MEITLENVTEIEFDTICTECGGCEVLYEEGFGFAPCPKCCKL